MTTLPTHDAAPMQTFTPAPRLTLTRMGYGAMQLTGPGIFGPPKDHDAAIAVLREVVALGVRHIDTCDYYGPFVVNRLIREALYPYPDDLKLVTKIGALRDEKDGSWLSAMQPDQLRQAIEDNLSRLGLDALDAVNLRMNPGGPEFSVCVKTMADMQAEGLIRHIGLSNITLAQLDRALDIVPVATVQNWYNVVHRPSEALLRRCEERTIAFVPFFPLGGFTPLAHAVLDDAAGKLGATSQQIQLAWLLQHSPVICVIPGTSSLDHLRDNVAAEHLVLPPDVVAALDALGDESGSPVSHR